jgi:hypothetical protein
VGTWRCLSWLTWQAAGSCLQMTTSSSSEAEVIVVDERFDPMLRCQVSDVGPGAGPRPLRKGHGLWLVRAVADEDTASSGPHGSGP